MRPSLPSVWLSVDAVVVAHVDGDDLLVLDQQFQGDAVGKIDGDRMDALQFAAQGMQAQGGVEGVGLQQGQGFEVLLSSGGLFQPAGGPAVVGLGKAEPVAHGSLSSLVRCSVADSSTKRPAARSARVSARAASSSHSRSGGSCPGAGGGSAQKFPTDTDFPL